MRNSVDTFEADAVVHVRARRRCQLERAGRNSLAVAVALLVETGELPGWDVSDYDDDNGEDSGWAA
ncbi:hypothetical protein ACIA5H_28285 [Nocardia sp. NPDC051900]|uniref:hypothetical protein n=1 Tax=Nocardia sp. NPDC051900 TaxID=3364326 RepID=UPI00379E33B0